MLLFLTDPLSNFSMQNYVLTRRSSRKPCIWARSAEQVVLPASLGITCCAVLSERGCVLPQKREQAAHFDGGMEEPHGWRKGEGKK